MTISEVIADVNRYRPNHKAGDVEIIKWLSRFDAKVKADIMDFCIDSPEFDGYGIDTDRTTELLIKEPQFAELYRHYILAQVDLLQADEERYAEERALCDEMYIRFQGWYMDHHIPKPRFTRYW